MTCKFCGSPLPDGAMICDLCGNNQKASKPVGAFSFEGAKPATEKKGKPADRWNTGPSASMEGAGTDDFVPVKTKRKKVRGSFPIKKILVVLLVLAVIGGGAFGAWWFINNRAVDQQDEILDSFKKIARAKNAEYSITYTIQSGTQSQTETMSGGFSFEKSDKRYVSWATDREEPGKIIVTCMTEAAAYQVTETVERYYNLYLSNPSDYPNEKIVMIGNVCYDIVTLAENNYKQREDLFTEKIFDSMEKEQDDAELIARMSAEEKQMYDAAKKFQAELSDPKFLTDVLNAKRVKTSDAIVYEFDVDLVEFMKLMYKSLEGVIPADSQAAVSQLQNYKKEDLDKLGVSCTGRLTIRDGYASILTGVFKLGPTSSINLDLRLTNPGRTELPDDVKKKLDAISAK